MGWGFSTMVFIINRLPTLFLNGISPYEVLYGKTHSYSMFRTFGYLFFPYLHDYYSHKLATKSIPCVFIGYNSFHKRFFCLSRNTQHVYVSHYVSFDEINFPFIWTQPSHPSSFHDFVIFFESPLPTTPVIHSFHTPSPFTLPSKMPTCLPCTLDSPICHSSSNNTLTVSFTVATSSTTPAPLEVFDPFPLPSSTTNIHPMVTRVEAGITKLKAYHAL